MKIKYQPNKFRTAAMLLLAIALLAFSAQGAFAQSNDFFSNTQSADQRATAATPAAPGFDPCRGGTLTATSCTGAVAGSEPLLDPKYLGNTGTNTGGIFTNAGPGALTDNMLGIISGADASVTPIQTTACGVVTNASFAGLNCGDLRFDPTSQNQTIPTAGSNLTSVMKSNEAMDMTSCGAGNTMALCAADPSRMRIQMENGFVWNPTASSTSLPVNTANMPTIVDVPAADTCPAGTAANPAVCGQASLIQTTALTGSTNSVLSQMTSWNTTDSAAGAMGTAPIVTWQSHIVQAEFVGGGTFDQTLKATFTYNGTAFSPTQYPNGQSFTIREGGGGTPVETVP